MNRAAFTALAVLLMCLTAGLTGGFIAAVAALLGDGHGAAIPIPYAYAWAILTTAAGTFIPDVMRAITGHTGRK